MTVREQFLRELVQNYLSFDGVPYCEDGSTLEERFLEWHECSDRELEELVGLIKELAADLRHALPWIRDGGGRGTFSDVRVEERE